MPNSFEQLRIKGIIQPFIELQIPEIAQDYAKVLKEGKIRKPTSFICSISDEQGEELLYNDEKMVDIVKQGKGLGYVIGLF